MAGDIEIPEGFGKKIQELMRKDLETMTPEEQKKLDERMEELEKMGLFLLCDDMVDEEDEIIPSEKSRNEKV